MCVTFGVYIQFPPYSGVSAAFWATLKGDTARVVMTAYEYLVGGARGDLWATRLLGAQLVIDS